MQIDVVKYVAFNMHALTLQRSKTHFINLELGVDIVLGTNGYVWISATRQDKNIRKEVIRIRNCIECLNRMHCPISQETIINTYTASLQRAVALNQMLESTVCAAITNHARVSSSI